MATRTAQFKINGVFTSFTERESDGKWVANVQMPSTSANHYNASENANIIVGDDGNNKYVGEIIITNTPDSGEALVTTVDYTNTNFGEDLQFGVKESVAPIISNIYPSNNSRIITATPTISATVSDGDDGSGVISGSIKIDGVAVDTDDISLVDGLASYTPSESNALSDGEHTLQISATDKDGNTGTSSVITFTVDTIAPALVISSPADGTSVSTSVVPVTGTTDADSTVTAKLVNDNGTVEYDNITVGSDGSFSFNVNAYQGENTLTITSTDTAGNTTTSTSIFNVNTLVPELISITVDTNETTVSGFVEIVCDIDFHESTSDE